VESRETLGGTCLNVGCIPSKAMLHASESLRGSRQWHARPLRRQARQGVELDLARCRPTKTKAVGELTGGIEFLFKKNKVDLAEGPCAAFTDAQQHRPSRAKAILAAKEVVIATGSSVTPLPGVEVDNDPTNKRSSSIPPARWP
jgi:dihydrolipoamide dehydrogenase